MRQKTKVAITVAVTMLLMLLFSLPLLAADNTIKVADRSRYSREDNYLVNVTEKTTVATMKESIRNTEGIEFISYNGETLRDTDLVGTGTKIQLTQDGTVVDTLEIIIKGDTSKDGAISSTDYMRIKSYMASGYQFDAISFKAADVDGNGRITTADYLKIRYYFAKTFSLYDTTDYTKMYLDMTVDEVGYDVYQAFSGYSYGYRYGPTILINEDGSYDMWLASLGCFSIEADWITYQHSDDGKNWTFEKSVLQPTGNSLDSYSVCDPGVIYFNGYYYIGYTSTTYYKTDGLYNSGYVARSKNPDGPFEKWNGSGWGGDPVPVVKFDGWEQDNGAGWGAGELSFVVVDDTLYVYYTWRGYNDSLQQINQTRVSVADATDENWPATLEYKGVALTYSSSYAQDSADFAYVEEYDKWIGIATLRTRTDNSSIVVYQSNDGITFSKVSELNTNVMVGCHNIGISKRPNGHISIEDDLMIGYSYTGPEGTSTYKWGRWNTRLQKISIGIAERRNNSDRNNSNYKQELVLRSNVSSDPIGITVKSSYKRNGMNLIRYYKKNIDSGAFKIDLYTTTEAYSQVLVNSADGVTFTDYDTTLLRFDGFTCTPLKAGKTSVTAHYKGHQTTFEVEIVASGKEINMEKPAIVSFSSSVPKYQMQLSLREWKGITAYVEFEDGNKIELGTDRSRNLYSETDYPFTYSLSKSGIISIDSTEGRITPIAKGTTELTVSCNGFSYTVPVEVF